MAPIHDTDVALERWNKAEWSHYELWEKTEQRLKLRKQLWIGFTAILFILLSAVPILKDRWPKWRGLTATRHLSEELNHMKRNASIEQTSMRMRFQGSGSLSFVIEKVSDCQAPSGVTLRTGDLLRESERSSFVLMSPENGRVLGVPGLVEQLCYDPFKGANPLEGGGLSAVGIISAKDLTERRLDRVSLLLINGPSAEISFD